VHLLDRVDPAQATEAWRSMVAAGERNGVPDRALSWRYLVEERMFGPEYSVEALVRDGEIIFENVTAKTVIAGPHPVELGHVLPAPLDRSTREAFGTAIRALVSATQFATGMLHAEWIVGADGPALVECAGRCPGDRLVDLIDLAYGTRLRVAVIDLLRGRPTELPFGPHRGAAIRFLTAPPGVVSRVDGVEEATRLPGVELIHVGVSAGDETRPWSSSWDRPGYVIVTGPDGDQAGAAADRAASTVDIVTT